MSIQQNFPAISPTLSLNFARSKKLDPRITFTRTSSATRVNETGLVEVVPANSPRFDHSYDPVSGSVKSLGLLVEEQRQNLLTYSEDFSNTGWILQGATLSTNSLTSPSNTLTADKLIDTNTNESHYVYQQFNFVSGITYTFSVYAKKAELNYVWIQLPGTQFGVNQWRNFDLTTGDGSTGTAPTYSSTNIGNGWWRLTITSTATSSGSGQVQIVLRNSQSGGSSYQGDGVSGLYIWGAQLEQGSFPTSYIPTAATTATRTADNVRITGTNFSDFYNPSEGTFYSKAKYDGQPIVGIANRVVFSTLDNVGAPFWNAWWETNNNLIFVVEYPTLNYTVLLNGGLISLNQTRKSVVCYKENDFALSVNGSTPTTDNSGILPPNNRILQIGSINGLAWHLNGTISELTYYPKRLSNSQLQALTR